jgi:hypothetical protein
MVRNVRRRSHPDRCQRIYSSFARVVRNASEGIHRFAGENDNQGGSPG